MQRSGDIEKPVRTELKFRHTDAGESVQFEAEISVVVGAKEVTVSTGYTAITEPTEAFRLSLTVPTTGLRVTYQHPAEILPELYCFNVGGALSVIIANDTLHEWEHSGSFLPSHGVILTHSLTRRKGEKIAGRSVRDLKPDDDVKGRTA